MTAQHEAAQTMIESKLAGAGVPKEWILPLIEIIMSLLSGLCPDPVEFARTSPNLSAYMMKRRLLIQMGGVFSPKAHKKLREAGGDAMIAASVKALSMATPEEVAQMKLLMDMSR